MKWITRSKVKVDRVACPWLINRFVDRNAEFIFVPANQAVAEAKKQNTFPAMMAWNVHLKRSSKSTDSQTILPSRYSVRLSMVRTQIINCGISRRDPG